MNVQSIFAAHQTAAASDANSRRLNAAAHEFEASLMKEFLKPLEHDSLFSNNKQADSDDEEGSAGAIMSFGSQAMATAISERGGFGIATMILNRFRATSSTPAVDNHEHQLDPTAAETQG